MWKSGISEQAILRISKTRKLAQFDPELSIEEKEIQQAIENDAPYTKRELPEPEMLDFGVTHQTVKVVSLDGELFFMRGGTPWEAYSRKYEDDDRNAITLFLGEEAGYIVSVEELKKVSEAS